MNQGIDSTRIAAYGRQTASILLWIFLFLQWSLIQAQSPNNSATAAQVRRMLSEQQIDENVLRNKLKSKGIDIDQMSPQEIMLQQNIIEETVREIQQEQSLQKSTLSKSDSLAKALDPFQRKEIRSALSDSSSAHDPMAKDSLRLQDSLPPSPVYGHDFFRNKSLGDFQSAQALTAPESYVLGPGDKINVLIFGRSQADLNYEINPSGFIQPNQMPKIFLTGLSLKQAREMLENKFASYYVFGNGQFTVTLQASRSVTVNVFGEVQRAGSYRLSGFHSAWAALIAAGGPTTMGSVRNIQVVRGNTRKTLDVYAFLRNPSETFDFALQNNDIVYVPVADKQVVVTGAVRRPMVYELIKTDGVKELVEMAGGLSAEASKDWAQVIRKDLREMRVLDINLSDVLNNDQKIILQDGDSIQFKAIASDLRNYVKAQGAFYHIGSYDLQATPTVQKLLAKAVLHPQAKDDIAFILRRNNDRTQQVLVADLKAIAKGLQEDMPLKSEDEVWVYEQARYASEFGIEITGEVREPFRRLFPYQEGLGLAQALELAGGLKPEAAAKGYVLRTNPLTPKRTAYFEVQLRPVPAVFRLEAGDQLVVLNKDTFVSDRTVRIMGDVPNAGIYRFDPSLRIKDMITLAGGFNESANRGEIEIFRVDFPEGQPTVRTTFKVKLDTAWRAMDPKFALQPYDVVVVRKIPQYYLQEMVSLSGEVNKEGPYNLNRRNVHFSELLRMGGGITPFGDLNNAIIDRQSPIKGKVFFDGRLAIKHAGQIKYDPILRPGDQVTVPRRLNMVIIKTRNTNFSSAGTQDSIIVTFQGKLDAKEYINRYGGGVREVDTTDVYYKVKRQNGFEEVSRKARFGMRHPSVRPGDEISVILVPQRPKSKSDDKKVDWDKLSAKMITLLTTLALLRAYF